MGYRFYMQQLNALGTCPGFRSTTTRKRKMAWDDDKKAAVIAAYAEAAPTPENSMEIVKESADEYEAQQTKTVDTAKEVVSTATASIQPELEKIESKIASLTDSMRVMSDEMSDRKEELNDKWSTRMNEVEGLILPLLQNLAKDGDKREWIRWPNRTDILNSQIDKIKEVTRGDF